MPNLEQGYNNTSEIIFMSNLSLRARRSSRPREKWSTDNEPRFSSNSSSSDEVDSDRRRSLRLASTSINYSEISPKRKRNQQRQQSNTSESSASSTASNSLHLDFQSSNDESDDELMAPRLTRRRRLDSSSTDSSLQSGWIENNVENVENFVCIRCENQVFSSRSDLFEHLRVKHRLGKGEKAKNVLQRCLAKSREMFQEQTDSSSGTVGNTERLNNADNAGDNNQEENVGNVNNTDNVSNTERQNNGDNNGNNQDSGQIKCPCYQCDFVCDKNEELMTGHGLDVHKFSFTFANRMAKDCLATNNT